MAKGLSKVLTLAAIIAMAQLERLKAFVDRASSSQRVFAEMGKLRYQIEKELKPNQTIFGVLRKLGVKDSTINNAGYASRVFDLVEKGTLTEREFDSFTFADCFTICRVTSKRSAKRLSPEDVADVIRKGGKDWDKELESIYETGMTVKEATLVAAAPSSQTTGAATTATSSKPAGGKKGGDKSAAATTTAAAATPAAKPAAEAEPEVVVPLPPQGKLTAKDMLATLDGLETDLIGFFEHANEADRDTVVTRLFELAATCGSFCQSADAAAKKAA